MSLVYRLPNLTDLGEGQNSLPWPNDISLPLMELRMPAEWESQSAILMAWPDENTDWADILDEVRNCYKNIIKAIIEKETLVLISSDIVDTKKSLKDIDNGNIIYYTVPLNDTWARDFGPITIERDCKKEIIDFKFNGWGLKFASDKDNLITSALNDKGIFNAQYSNQLSFVLEGGSIESDGKGTILTTSECLMSKNRNGAFSKADIEQYLNSVLGAKRVLWLNHGSLIGDDTDGHIDTIARFINEDTIAYIKCDDSSDEHYNDFKLMEEELKQLKTNSGKPYNLISMPFASPVYYKGERLPATYANFLIINDRVLLPIYNQQEKDEQAIALLKEAFPNREIVAIDCNALIKQHGSLHCVTMQFPKEIISKRL